jgi:hypothetical protein
VFGSTSKKQKIGSDAIILHPPPGLKRHIDGYSFTDIGVDLQRATNEVTSVTNRMVNAVCSTTETTTADLAATAAAVAASVQNELAPDDVATNAAVNSTSGLMHHDTSSSNGIKGHHEHEMMEEQSTNAGDINALYDKAYSALTRSIFLLSQWKTSWDAAIAAAVAQEGMADHGLADAVASAAAVAAAAASGDAQNSNVASLLLAANDDDKSGDLHDDPTKDVETFEV